MYVSSRLSTTLYLGGPPPGMPIEIVLDHKYKYKYKYKCKYKYNVSPEYSLCVHFQMVDHIRRKCGQLLSRLLLQPALPYSYDYPHHHMLSSYDMVSV